MIFYDHGTHARLKFVVFIASKLIFDKVFGFFHFADIVVQSAHSAQQ